jgi:Sulfotransferase domain.
MCWSAEGRNLVALSATRAASRFLDASSKGTPLPGQSKQDEATWGAALQRRTRRLFLESIKDLSMRRHIDLDSYGRLFRHKGPLLSGDISPTYSTLSDEIIERVVDHFPNLKVVFLARDPVERAWSQLSMGVHLGVINKFEATDPEEVVRNLLIPGVLARSHPSKIVARWKRYVRPENFRLYFFDDLKENPAELRQSILRFLGRRSRQAKRQIKTARQ